MTSCPAHSSAAPRLALAGGTREVSAHHRLRADGARARLRDGGRGCQPRRHAHDQGARRHGDRTQRAALRRDHQGPHPHASSPVPSRTPRTAWPLPSPAVRPLAPTIAPPCHPATLPPCHPATLPPCHPATLVKQTAGTVSAFDDKHFCSIECMWFIATTVEKLPPLGRRRAWSSWRRFSTTRHLSSDCSSSVETGVASTRGCVVFATPTMGRVISVCCRYSLTN